MPAGYSSTPLAKKLGIKEGHRVGLIGAATLSATVPIAADGTLADINLVGFHRLEGDGDQIDFVYKADGVTQVTVASDILSTALVADTAVRLGFHYEEDTALLTFYVNGTPSATTKTIPSDTGTDFPADVLLSPCMAVLNATGTTPGASRMDMWCTAQLNS